MKRIIVLTAIVGVLLVSTPAQAITQTQSTGVIASVWTFVFGSGYASASQRVVVVNGVLVEDFEAEDTGGAGVVWFWRNWW